MRGTITRIFMNFTSILTAPGSCVYLHRLNHYNRLVIIHLMYTQNFQKIRTSYPLIRTRTCAHQVIRNPSFSEVFAHVLNKWLPIVYVSKNKWGFANIKGKILLLLANLFWRRNEIKKLKLSIFFAQINIFY